uniref:Uncharacterized protein n=1 Tax=Rhabditophanes sp. KR3021 TaxID=114890 RepID=A0AC35TXH1_9BILA
MTADSNNNFNLILVFVFCFVFCMIVRYLNDFYSGRTITLVEEGTWVGRYKHVGSTQNEPSLRMIEKEFDAMYSAMEETNKRIFADYHPESE